MDCKYSYRDKKEDDFGMHYIYCNILNGIKCPLVRRCSTVKDFVNIDNYKICSYYKKEGDNIIMAKGKYPVRYEKHGRLYVSVNGQIEIVENKFGTNYPNEVELVKVKDKYFIKGYQPKINKTKKVKNEEKREENQTEGDMAL